MMEYNYPWDILYQIDWNWNVTDIQYIKIGLTPRKVKVDNSLEIIISSSMIDFVVEFTAI